MVEQRKSTQNLLTPPRKGQSLAGNPFYDRYPFNDFDSGIPTVQLKNLYQRSFRKTDRVSPARIRAFSRTVAAQRAFSKITTGVLNMDWHIPVTTIDAPEEEITQTVDRIKLSLEHPNEELEQDTYHNFINCLVEELLVRNRVMIERAWGGHPGKERFWLWITPVDYIKFNPDWKPHLSGLTPKFYGPGVDGEETSFLASQMFSIIYNPSAAERNPQSPLEIAYNFIDTFLGLSDFQRNATSRGTRDYILNLVNATEDEVTDFRRYWSNDIEGEGKLPIVGGEGVSAVRVGARSDEELYPRYTEFILRMIALCFNLSARDFNIQEKDNRATAEVSADVSFSEAIFPMARCIIEGLNRGATSYYCPGYKIALNSIEKRKEEEEARIVEGLYEKNVFTRNEARERMGAETFPDGDRFSDGTLFTKDETPPDDNSLDDNTPEPSPSNPEKVVPIKPAKVAASVADNGQLILPLEIAISNAT